MNGRCETDPLDRAVDVCDNCYGEFCPRCLVTPRGRRHPVCTDCTLALSGVRGHATAPVRGDRRTAKQRRAELKAAATEANDEQVFRFFDADAPLDAPPATVSRKRGRRKRAGSPEPTGGTASAGPGASPSTDHPAPAATGATAALGEGRTTPAVARLEQLRKQREATDEPEDAPTATPDTNPAAGPDESPAPIETPASDETPAPIGPPARTETSAPTRSEPTRLNGSPAPSAADRRPARRPGTGSTVGDTGRVGAATEQSARPPAVQARRRASDHDTGPEPDRPATAPMIGEVRTIGGRRATDQPQAAPVAPGTGPDDDDDDLVSLREALAGIEQFDARQSVAPHRSPVPATVGSEDGGDGPDGQDSGPDGPKADTDQNGNWIPPLLRGMAPDARQASSNLPQRRRG